MFNTVFRVKLWSLILQTVAVALMVVPPVLSLCRQVSYTVIAIPVIVGIILYGICVFCGSEVEKENK
jgi:hypothetical protein